MNPSSSHTFTPKGFVEISAALNAFYVERLGQGAEELPQSRFDELNDELRQRLFAGEFRLTVMTAEGLLEEVPAQRWAHPKVWAALLAGGVSDLIGTDDPRLAGPLLMAHGALETLIGGTSTPRATATATDERPSHPDLSPYLQLMIAFSRARPDLYGTKRYLKKDVLEAVTDLCGHQFWRDAVAPRLPVRCQR